MAKTGKPAGRGRSGLVLICVVALNAGSRLCVTGWDGTCWEKDPKCDIQMLETTLLEMEMCYADLCHSMCLATCLCSSWVSQIRQNDTRNWPLVLFIQSSRHWLRGPTQCAFHGRCQGRGSMSMVHSHEESIAVFGLMKDPSIQELILHWQREKFFHVRDCDIGVCRSQCQLDMMLPWSLDARCLDSLFQWLVSSSWTGQLEILGIIDWKWRMGGIETGKLGKGRKGFLEVQATGVGHRSP